MQNFSYSIDPKTGEKISKRKAFRTVANCFLSIHVGGGIISFFIFSYQYAREHGFWDWFFLGEFIPALKSMVWEIFLIIFLIQSPTSETVIPSKIQDLLIKDFWWRAEYPILVKTVTDAKNSSLSASYKTGPKGQAIVKLLLYKDSSGGLVLIKEYPKEAIFSLDPKTGKKIPSKASHTIIIRDHDLDGKPDDFNLEPPQEPLYKEELTKDGFIRFRNVPEHEIIILKWSSGIAFSVNHFLYGIDSALPRKKLKE